MSKTSNLPPKVKVDLYDKLIDTNPEIARKGKSMPYTSLNGHMFTYLSKSGSLGIRLPKEEREAFLEKFNTTLYESHGAIMKEYVTVPDGLLENTEELKKYLNLSYEYVKTLKPKPTKKKS
jgi:TfoX/Sxy family transcriptional regulator of competence genes